MYVCARESRTRYWHMNMMHRRIVFIPSDPHTTTTPTSTIILLGKQRAFKMDRTWKRHGITAKTANGNESRSYNMKKVYESRETRSHRFSRHDAFVQFYILSFSFVCRILSVPGSRHIAHTHTFRRHVFIASHKFDSRK